MVDIIDHIQELIYEIEDVAIEAFFHGMKPNFLDEVKKLTGRLRSVINNGNLYK